MARKQKLEWDTPREAFMKVVGANLKAKREAAGLTTTELGGKVGLSHPTISGIEHGKRDFLASYLDRFAEVLEVPVEDLIRPAPALAPDR
jgi:transcriptional regulator with XRE-family HTH domain